MRVNKSLTLINYNHDRSYGTHLQSQGFVFGFYLLTLQSILLETVSFSVLMAALYEKKSELSFIKEFFFPW